MTKSDDKRVPTLRFKGFTDEWEQRKLGCLMNITSVKRIHQSDWRKKGIPFYRARDITALSKNLNIEEPIFISRDLYEEYSKISGKVQINDLLVTGVGTIGVPLLVQTVPLYFKDGNIIWFQNSNKLIGLFFLYLFKTNTVQKYIHTTTGVGTVPTYTIQSGKNTPVYITSKKEQKDIGTIFQLIDNLISLQQRKLKLLKLLKKAMLQTLFTNKSIPNLRFISFDKSWDIVKLKDVGKATGGTSIESEFTSIEGTHKVISIGSYKENHTYNDQGIRVNLNDKTKKRVLNKDDLTMILNDKTTSGRIIGSVLLIPVDNVFVYNQRTERIEPNHKKFSSKFLYQYLNSPNIRNKIVSNAQGNTQIYVNWSSISKIKYLMPQKKEQDKISKLLFTLDFIINNQQLRIKKYERFKQFLLQNMFI